MLVLPETPKMLLLWAKVGAFISDSCGDLRVVSCDGSLSVERWLRGMVSIDWYTKIESS